jgi:hydrogenase maturation protease
LRYLVGLGNYMAFDDSIGVRVVEFVAANDLERGFRAIDLGANPLNLVAYLHSGTTAILVVDAARMGLAPGRFRTFTPDRVASRKQVTAVTTHEGDVLRILGLARDAGELLPPIAFFGIEPEVIRQEVGLSPTLDARVPEYAREAISTLLQLGHGA